MAVFASRQIVLPQMVNYVTYIQSTGTQYIDTGFKPNQDTGVHIVFEPTETQEWRGIFGARSASGVAEYGLDIPGGTQIRSMYGSDSTGAIKTVDTVVAKFTAHKDKNICTINGDTLISDAETFSPGYSLWLFDKNTAGESWHPGSLKMYSCQIYDNGVLVRDLWPCYDPDGVACLYDKVEKKYYYNAGTGEFIAGEAA